MMNAWIHKVIALALLFILANIPTITKATTVQAQWYCPHHIRDSSLPQKQTIDITLGDDGSFQSPDLQKLMQQAQQLGGKYDFYDCVQNIVFSEQAFTLRILLYKQDKKQGKYDSSTWHKTQIFFSRKAEEINGSQSLLLPGLALKHKLPETLKEYILSDFKKGYVYPGEHLSKEALEELLPQAIESIKLKHTPQAEQNMLKGLASELIEAFNYQSKGWQDHPDYPRAKQIFQKALSTIDYPLTPYEVGVLCPDNFSPELRQIHQLTQALKAAPHCVNLEVGEHQHIPRYGYRNGYLLRRLLNKDDKGRYEIAFALNFITPDSMAPEEVQQERNHMRQKTAQCFKNYADKFKNPLTGEQIKFNIAYVASDDDEFEQEKKSSIPLLQKKNGKVEHAGVSMPVSSVSIISEEHLTNSAEWARDVGCAVIIHEVLHHLGLADEYKETRIGDDLPDAERKDPYHCRAVGPEDSIMSSHTNSLFSLCSSQEINKLANDCLDKFRPDIQAGNKCYQNAVKEDGFCKGGRASLLYPVHFQAITRPGCAVNALYTQCTAQAYTKNINSNDAENPNVCIKAANPECQNMWHMPSTTTSTISEEE